MSESIYLALDFPTWKEASVFIDTHDFYGIPVKVGMELYYREGPQIIEKLKENNHKIFLDLKLHDIPTTVMRAMKVLANLEVDMVNVHALGGSEMIAYAKEGLVSGSSGFDTKLLAVTVLTSMGEVELNKELGIQTTVTDTVVRLANIAKQNGADGVVCSVQEASHIKATSGKEFITVTPGIRLHNSDVNDQVRVATPNFARNNGADYLVMGRSITNAINPREAYELAVAEWEESR